MSGSRSEALLVELARLFRRFGSDAFADAARIISDPQRAAEVVAVLDGISRAAKSKKPEKSASRTRHSASLEQLIRETALADAGKGEIILAFYDGFRARSVLPKVEDVRAFAKEWNLSCGDIRTRRDSLRPIIQALIALPTAQLKENLQASIALSGEDRDLAGWSRLILDRERKPKI